MAVELDWQGRDFRAVAEVLATFEAPTLPSGAARQGWLGVFESGARFDPEPRASFTDPAAFLVWTVRYLPGLEGLLDGGDPIRDGLVVLDVRIEMGAPGHHQVLFAALREHFRGQRTDELSFDPSMGAPGAPQAVDQWHSETLEIPFHGSPI